MVSSLAAVTGESLRAEILPDYYPARAARAEFFPGGRARGGGRGGGDWDC